MIGYGTYNLPPGTFSDDSSLTFCLAEALTSGFDLNTIGQNFVKWYHENYWTPHGNVFDIGIATRQAISRLAHGENPELAGGSDEYNNGNGSLMRILPLIFDLLDKPINKRFDITKQVSSITHGHIRSIIACFYYLEFAKKILEGKDETIPDGNKRSGQPTQPVHSHCPEVQVFPGIVHRRFLAPSLYRTLCQLSIRTARHRKGPLQYRQGAP